MSLVSDISPRAAGQTLETARCAPASARRGALASAVVDRLACAVSGGSLAAAVLGLVDLVRNPEALRPAALAASAGAFLAAGALGGLVSALVWWPLHLAWRAQRARWAPLFVAVCVGGLAFLTGYHALHAPLATKSVGLRWYLLLVAAAAGSVVAVLAHLASRRLRRAHRASSRIAGEGIVIAFGLLALGCDQLFLVSLYERAHSALEGIGFLTLSFSFASVLARRRDVRFVRPVALAAVAWLLLFAGSRSVRRSLERALPSTWEQPVYLGRIVRRLRQLEFTMQNGARPDIPAGVRYLAERYETHDTKLAGEWHMPGATAPAAIPIAAPSAGPWNVVVFFVDALRADVAFDPATMPDTVAWMRQQRSFSRAYATGSSTLLTLAQTLNCRYEATSQEPPVLLRVAREQGMTTALFIPKSASDFHTYFSPHFHFDHKAVVTDITQRREPTAAELVDRSLAWLKATRPDRFLLWVYQFDVHSWGDIAESYADAIATEERFSKSQGLPWRYRSAARGVDRAFSRFREGLRALGLADRTILVFLSDHGEALGQQGHWVHTTYLWESLLRVPLAIAVPGLPARSSDVPVSLIDLPTSLSRFIGPIPNEARCHGQDLLGAETTERRLPILFSATVDGQLARVGLLASADRKLVVDLRGGDARLLRLPQEDDVSEREAVEVARALDRLVRSPVYPRN